MVKINKNNIMEKKPKYPMLPKVIAHGNKKAISKSKMMKRIATR